MKSCKKTSRRKSIWALAPLAAKIQASQGQQRSLVLSLKTAECELFKSVFESYPLLLLDDILSELDLSRQRYITESIEKFQVVLTSCEKEKFFPDRRANLYLMENGHLNKS